MLVVVCNAAAAVCGSVSGVHGMRRRILSAHGLETKGVNSSVGCNATATACFALVASLDRSFRFDVIARVGLLRFHCVVGVADWGTLGCFAVQLLRIAVGFSR